MNLEVNELFYSLQGEGGRQGEASIFVRLTRCNLRCDFCDTDFERGETLSLDELADRIASYPCRWIVWTGGEPSLQLTDEVFRFFREKGYSQAIESNGHRPLSELLDYTVVSPKGEVDYAQEINPRVDEVRLPLRAGQTLPSIERLPVARYYCLSPIFESDQRQTQANIAYCVEQIMQHTQWRLSLQMHKLIGIE